MKFKRFQQNKNYLIIVYWLVSRIALFYHDLFQSANGPVEAEWQFGNETPGGRHVPSSETL